jgi:hypothetical protein
VHLDVAVGKQERLAANAAARAFVTGFPWRVAHDELSRDATQLSVARLEAVADEAVVADRRIGVKARVAVRIAELDAVASISIVRAHACLAGWVGIGVGIGIGIGIGWGRRFTPISLFAGDEGTSPAARRGAEANQDNERPT